MLVSIVGHHDNVDVSAGSVQGDDLTWLTVGEDDVVKVTLRAGDVLTSRYKVVSRLGG